MTVSSAGNGAVTSPPNHAGAPVLVVEDERDLAEEIRLELQASGHPVLLLETVDDGLRAARNGPAASPPSPRRF